MKDNATAARRCRVPDDPQVLHETIVLMEARLRSLGDGDCAYEKAMIRFYEQQLSLHRARLMLQAAETGAY
jgi:hypothetical protein